VKSIKYVYVAGPISKGDQFMNVRNAILVGERLRAAGLVPFVPHLSALWNLIVPVGYEDWMALDFSWIERCDAVLRMDGESSGADREVVFTNELGKPVFYSEEELLTAVAASKAA
jgi:hypothetical protein